MAPSSRGTIVGLAVASGLGLAAIGGFISGEARETGRLGASRFATSEAEAAARQACASNAPFVVLDTFGVFKPANVEEASPEPGDERPRRLLHGDIVAAIAEASHPGAIAYQTDPRFNVRSLVADFGRLARDVESGRIAKPAAVVSSIVLPVDLAQVNARLRVDRPFDQSNVLARKREVLEALSESHGAQNPYAQIDGEMARLRKAGVPVFVAAGNTGPDQTVNALALSEGVYAVGSLDRDGARTTYTSAPGLVSIWSPGFVVLTDAPGGLSVSGGLNVELKGADLPEQRAVIARYGGKRAADVALRPPSELRQIRSPGRRANGSGFSR
ncbi:hypothetical protein [Chenggangzhangella methanolivorans]|uniref:Uncharacterized protein n=1 Tax=Chenggangzhangella methanolivorans TaxID=1437009 RepID=A0A9E6R6V3_9HYPH|nr:hypothetical protein [Chenggangzhangella methanolivorans]QZN99038.1 hypothetical protein K6K41_19530 [Chenggangzhangella methanolivorans]